MISSLNQTLTRAEFFLFSSLRLFCKLGIQVVCAEGDSLEKMANNLEEAFHEAMLNIYDLGNSRYGYRATRFLRMVGEQGGLSAAKQLLSASEHPEGLTTLWELGGLEISMEALVLESRWASLFTERELGVARNRLEELGFDPD